MASTPLAFSSDAFSLKPGRCRCEQVGVKAPGTANRATVLPANSSSVLTGLGPSGPMVVNVAWGTLSPALTAICISFAHPLGGKRAGHPLVPRRGRAKTPALA